MKTSGTRPAAPQDQRISPGSVAELERALAFDRETAALCLGCSARQTRIRRSRVRLGVPSELDGPGLVRMQGQIELAEPLSKRMQEAFRVPPVLEPNDHIVGHSAR